MQSYLSTASSLILKKLLVITRTYSLGNKYLFSLYLESEKVRKDGQITNNSDMRGRWVE